MTRGMQLNGKEALLMSGLVQERLQLPHPMSHILGLYPALLGSRWRCLKQSAGCKADCVVRPDERCLQDG